jgi:hypothetical protein
LPEGDGIRRAVFEDDVGQYVLGGDSALYLGMAAVSARFRGARRLCHGAAGSSKESHGQG